MIVQYRHRPIKLLGEHDSREPVGQRERRKRPVERGTPLQRLREAVRTADDEGEVGAGMAPALETPGELHRREQAAALVQGYPETAAGNGREYAPFLGFEQPFNRAAGAAALGLDFRQREA